MRDSLANMQAKPGAGTHRYEGLSLVQLADRITRSDRLALKEFHDARPVFKLQGGQPLLLATFVDMLRETRWAMNLVCGNESLLEHAYDLAVDKFALMPVEGPRSNRDGPDCRNAFRSFLRVMDRLVGTDHAEGTIRDEMLAARILQRRVVRCFQLCCLDARRMCNPTRTRYAWRVDGHVIYVWMPTHVKQTQRRQWLDRNVQDADPQRPGERYRVQAIIDDRLGIARQVSIGNEACEPAPRCTASSPLDAMIDREVRSHGLAKVVAEEKAENIGQQRPAIRALGKLRLRELVLQVFKDLGEESYEEKQLAESFGLSRATFSRFAGSRWRIDFDREIPDLWANTAETLANHELFIETAAQAGVWEQVEMVLATCRASDMGRQADA